MVRRLLNSQIFKWSLVTLSRSRVPGYLTWPYILADILIQLISNYFKTDQTCRTEADQVLEHGVLAQVSVLQLTDDVSLPGLRRPAAATPRSQDPAAALRHSG